MVFLLILNLFFFSLSKAGELESLIDYALKNSPRLKVYQSMIESTKHRETYSKSLPNPSLSVGLNNLPLNRPYPNKYEPMSNLSIGISQMYMLPIKREREALMALKERLALLEEEELLITEKTGFLSFIVILRTTPFLPNLLVISISFTALPVLVFIFFNNTYLFIKSQLFFNFLTSSATTCGGMVSSPSTWSTLILKKDILSVKCGMKKPAKAIEKSHNTTRKYESHVPRLPSFIGKIIT